MLLVAGVIVILALVASAAFVLTRPKATVVDNAGTGTGASTTVPPAHGPVGPACKPLTASAPGATAAPAKDGGTLRVGLADESDGFETSRGLTTSGLLIASAIYDPLAQLNDDGTVTPFLASKIDHNADFTQFSITLTSGVTFHDGSKLDAQAVEANMAVFRNNKVTAAAYANIKDLKVVDDLNLVITMGVSWPTFLLALTGQFGYVESPAVLGKPEAGKRPVGTGPYQYKDWRPGEAFVVTKNPNYWRKDGMPHLDSIEFRPITDDLARVKAYETGEVDVIVASDADAIAKLQADGPTQASTAFINFVALNTSKPPFDDPNARRALALATDPVALASRQHSDLVQPLSSPFPSDSAWCVDDTGAPGYDATEAKRLASDYEKAHGGPMTFNLDVPSTADAPALAKALVEMWGQVGIKATVNQLERTTFVFNLVGGKYTAGLHSTRSVRDPDTFYEWFHSDASNSSTSLNLSRISDPAIDKVLEIGRTSTEINDRKAAYAELVRLLNKDLPFLWLDSTPQAITTAPKVKGAAGLVSPLRPVSRPWSTDLWIDA